MKVLRRQALRLLLVEAIHQVDCLEQDLSVLDLQLCSNLEEPVNDGRSQLPGDPDLISQESIELRLVLMIDHVIEKLPPVLLQVAGLLDRDQRRSAAAATLVRRFIRLS